jgi:hypothetical protein
MRSSRRKAKRKLDAAAPKLKQVHSRGRETARRVRKRAPIAS